MYYNIKWTVVCGEEADALETSAVREAPGSGEKRRVSLSVAGRTLTLVTDEDPAAVKELERELDSRVASLCRSARMSSREGRMDALILCAVDALCREKNAETRARLAEERAAESERAYRDLLGEYRRLSSRAAVPPDRGPSSDEDRPEAFAADLERIRQILRAIRDRNDRNEGERA